jgi:hypothetical protein
MSAAGTAALDRTMSGSGLWLGTVTAQPSVWPVAVGSDGSVEHRLATTTAALIKQRMANLHAFILAHFSVEGPAGSVRRAYNSTDLNPLNLMNPKKSP